MSYQQRAYDDFDSTGQMVLDCAACGERVDLFRRRHAGRLDVTEAPEDLPWAKTKRDIELAEAAAHLAARRYLA